ncbi:MAG: 2-dehydropantoate 2-reductase [Candidatus Omnitrophica bacterium ADurb.Bin277]|nr:MAG: 2-dehydropantoate 2-reductase [Candidatus Omnitrophica bacterium ADurb.Bin277]
MKILVFGAGAIGSAFGGFLSKGHEVTLLGRKPHVEAIRKRGLKVSGIWGRHTFRPGGLATCIYDLDRSAPYDLILCTVKSYSTSEAAGLIKKIMGPKTIALSLQNGLGNIETLCKALPPKQVLGGRVIFGVELSEPGNIHVSVIARPTAVGEVVPGGKITSRVRRIVRVFNEAKLPSVSSADVRGLLWLKVVYNAALNPLASLMRSHYGVLGEDPAARDTMNAVIDEVYAVAHGIGMDLKPATPAGYKKLFYSKLLPRTCDHHPSMLQDLEKGKKTEIDSINGFILKLGKERKIPTPVNAYLVRAIKKAEKETG